jgi:F420-dependent oxidoreductase-like protein
MAATVWAAVASDKGSPARDSDLAAAGVRLGLNLGYWGLGAPVDQQLELVLEAERLGFDSVWTAEAYGSDAATPLAWLAGQTSTIGLGSAIFQIPGRSAGMTAMTAATLDHLTSGRFRLGLGTSGPQVSEGWHGVRFGKQLARTRDYVEVVRMALRRERVDYGGETLTLPLPDGPGKALKLTIGTVQEQIPIYIAAIGPKNTALAAEIADGWLPVLVSPEHMAEFRPALEQGWAAAGRTGADFDIAPTVTVRVDDDLDAARDVMRGYVALYVGGMGSRQKNFYNRLVASYGFEDAAREVQELFLEGKKDEAMAALPGELIDAVALCGPADRVRERLAIYRQAGVGTLLLSPMASTLEERTGQLRQIAELAAAA